MALHSQSSSQVEVDYYTHYSHSASSSLGTGPGAFPAPPTSSKPPPISPERSRKKSSLARIDVPSFSQFRSQVSGIPVASPTTAKRKPLPSPIRPASNSVAEKASPRLAEPVLRPFSLDSPVKQQSDGTTSPQAEKYTTQPPDRSSFTFPSHSHDRNDSLDSRFTQSNPASSQYNVDSRPSSIPIHARYAHERTLSHAPRSSLSSLDYFASGYSPVRRQSAVSPMHSAQEPPSMRLELNGIQRTLTGDSSSSLDSQDAKVPKSPGARLGSFFGWKSGQKSSPESPSTAFSDRSQSPMLSAPPQIHNPADATSTRTRLTPPGLDIQKANSQHRTDYFDNEATPILLGSPGKNMHVSELEKELTQVSTELAESIKREMELEDEIDRMRADLPNALGSDINRRSSDYFSDSGASSNRFPTSDPESKLEQMEQKLRKAEQEKAQVKVEMAARLQTELSRRRDLEMIVQKMEEQIQNKCDEESERSDMEERVEELESTLEDTRRLLSQERQAKASFEDLYTATKEELETHMNQHDNLRDEVVPQLKARIDGLESEATDNQNLMYENSRMQQELATLRSTVNGRFKGIAEAEEGLSMSPTATISRSGSLLGNTSRRGGSLGRSATGTDTGRSRAGSGNGVVYPEAFKEIEDQRDALHKALKLMIIRSEKQQKDHARAIKKLSSAKSIAESSTPTRSAYQTEVAFLKEEVATLRKRTEDALEQKWQYEKGLSGIKMDLDRAELETRGLRIILQEHDILGSSQRTLLGNGKESGEVADDRLQESITTAETERDQARKVAAEYRQRAQDVQDGSSTELITCAKRMDELADQLEKQVQSNIELRSRLADAVARGEREQRESSGKIGEMQKRLASMEDSVLTAQQHSETTLGNHEAEVRKLEDASSPALQRLRISVPNSRRSTPLSPLMAKSPKLGSKKLSENSLLEMSKTQMLERKVKELESLLREAEEDMQDVVQKVNQSQLEVAELQTEKDAAFSQMRKLQAQIVAEREKAETLMR